MSLEKHEGYRLADRKMKLDGSKVKLVWIKKGAEPIEQTVRL